MDKHMFSMDNYFKLYSSHSTNIAVQGHTAYFHSLQDTLFNVHPTISNDQQQQSQQLTKQVQEGTVHWPLNTPQ